MLILKIWLIYVDILAIVGGFTKSTLPITEHVINDVHFGITILHYFCALMKTILLIAAKFFYGSLNPIQNNSRFHKNDGETILSLRFSC